MATVDDVGSGTGTGTGTANDNVDTDCIKRLEPVCRKCQANYTDESVVPMLLSCGHSICKKCADEMQDPIHCAAVDCNSHTARSSLRVNYALDELDNASAALAANRTESAADILNATCPICMNPYTDDNKTPYALACGHTFCADCIARITLPNGTIPCPNRCAVSTHVSHPETAPVKNSGLVAIVTTLRAMHGLPPPKEPELPQWKNAAAQAASADGATSSNTAGGPGIAAAPATPTPATAPQIPRFIYVLVLVYLASMIITTICCLIFVPRNECSSLRFWLPIMVLLAVLVSFLDWMVRSPKIRYAAIRHKCFKWLHLTKTIVAFIWLFWIFHGIRLAWMTIHRQRDCDSKDALWVVCTTILAFHLALVGCHFLIEMFLVMCDRRLGSRLSLLHFCRS
eukprot:TRINITY_DN66791_c7_g5_i3.p1 TRINITY_DN66791_c7_g5~~TRINITY_DN66791_c7_g5_i3.p1  ORF type:complete len:399 (+),score=22.37 TRINITY_DN66791_c7_g5_i3:46-1242(+)